MTAKTRAERAPTGRRRMAYISFVIVGGIPLRFDWAKELQVRGLANDNCAVPDYAA